MDGQLRSDSTGLRRKATGRRPGIPARTFALFSAGTAGAAGAFIAANYPLGPTFALAAFAGFCVLSAISPLVALMSLLALVPVIGFAPWTGWITFEEVDLLALATLCGGYLQTLLARSHPDRAFPGTAQALIVLGFAVTLVAMLRGFADAKGFVFSWYQGYYEPMNSLRLAKAFALAGLMAPLVHRMATLRPERFRLAWSWGFAIGLVGTALAVIVERSAYTGLLDFSSDYRATGPFWEMHIGGAALDGYLALALPFAFYQMHSARSVTGQAVWTAATLLAGYACLTTFSRGVYLAVPLSLLAYGFLHVRQASRETRGSLQSPAVSPLRLGLAVGIFAAAASAAFAGSGYRGLLALIGSAALGIGLARLRLGDPIRFTPANYIGIVIMAAVTAGLAWMLPKGPYVMFALVWIACLVAIILATLRPTARSIVIARMLFPAPLVAALLVGLYWNEGSGLAGMAAALTILLALLAWRWVSRTPPWPDSLRHMPHLASGMLAIAGAVAVFGGGAYMAERFSTSSADFGGRIAHWRLGYELLNSSDELWFGKGLGRFPTNYLFALPDGEFPGSYRFVETLDGNHVALTGSKHPMGFGQIMRLSQRLRYSPSAHHRVQLDVRAPEAVSLHVEICAKHLLYTNACADKEIRVAASEDATARWQTVTAELDTGRIASGPWYESRHIVFSVGIESRAGAADIRNLHLVNSEGQEQLANGDFSRGFAHWFSSSDHLHMPWHIKSLAMNLLFDQGIIGLSFFLLAIGVALWRLGLGKARRHPLAPALFASLTGLLVVGLFDSLIDSARIGFCFWLVVMLSLCLRSPPRNPSRPDGVDA